MIIIYTIHAMAFVAFIVVMMKLRDAMRQFPKDIDTVLKNHTNASTSLSCSDQFLENVVSELGEKLKSAEYNDCFELLSRFESAKNQYAFGMIDRPFFQKVLSQIESRHVHNTIAHYEKISIN